MNLLQLEQCNSLSTRLQENRTLPLGICACRKKVAYTENLADAWHRNNNKTYTFNSSSISISFWHPVAG